MPRHGVGHIDSIFSNMIPGVRATMSRQPGHAVVGCAAVRSSSIIFAWMSARVRVRGAITVSRLRLRVTV